MLKNSLQYNVANFKMIYFSKYNTIYITRSYDVPHQKKSTSQSQHSLPNYPSQEKLCSTSQRETRAINPQSLNPTQIHQHRKSNPLAVSARGVFRQTAGPRDIPISTDNKPRDKAEPPGKNGASANEPARPRGSALGGGPPRVPRAYGRPPCRALPGEPDAADFGPFSPAAGGVCGHRGIRGADVRRASAGRARDTRAFSTVFARLPRPEFPARRCDRGHFSPGTSAASRAEAGNFPRRGF